MVLAAIMVPTGIGIYVSKTVAPLLSQRTYDTPGTVVMQLGVGTYYVYEDTGGFNEVLYPVLQPDNVTVSSSDGLANPPYAPTVAETLGANGTNYEGEVAFNVVNAGDFRIQVRSPQGNSISFFVAPSIVSTLTRNLGWLGLSGGGGLLFILGLVLLVVRGVQRSRRRAPAPQLEPRCTNGHLANPEDHFCHSCGAPVYAAAPVMAPPR
jgi:hypothetical protein